MIIKNTRVLENIEILENLILDTFNNKDRDFEFNSKIKRAKHIINDLTTLELYLDIHDKEYDSLSDITDYGDTLVEYIEKEKEIVNLLEYFQVAVKEFKKLCKDEA